MTFLANVGLVEKAIKPEIEQEMSEEGIHVYVFCFKKYYILYLLRRYLRQSVKLPFLLACIFMNIVIIILKSIVWKRRMEIIQKWKKAQKVVNLSYLMLNDSINFKETQGEVKLHLNNLMPLNLSICVLKKSQYSAVHCFLYIPLKESKD